MLKTILNADPVGQSCRAVLLACPVAKWLCRVWAGPCQGLWGAVEPPRANQMRVRQIQVQGSAAHIDHSAPLNFSRQPDFSIKVTRITVSLIHRPVCDIRQIAVCKCGAAMVWAPIGYPGLQGLRVT